MNRVDRLMGYLLLFQSRGLMRAQDFAEQFEISERTVYRDVQALCEVGVPIVAMPGEGYRLMEGYYLPPITFSPDEARALYLALSMLAGTAKPGTTQSAAHTALEKIRSVLPVATLCQVEALQAVTNFYSFPTNALDFDDEKLLALQEAIHGRNVVHIRYHAMHSNDVTERDVEPKELIFVAGAWLLIGYCRLRQGPRFFRLDRIDALKRCVDRFSPRELGRYDFEPMPIEVVVRFDHSIVRWVGERQHYALVEQQAVDDYGVIMSYRPRSLDQFESWLLTWGDAVEVLSPPELRWHMAETARRIIARHQ